MVDQLHAYIIGSYSVNELDLYDSYELEGNDPYLVSTFSTIGSYSNITSMENWDLHGDCCGILHRDIRQNISDIWTNEKGSTWSGLTLSEKETLSKYFLVDKSRRDEVHTQEEQDAYDHYLIYDYLSEDALERLGNLNEKTTPKSIDYKKDIDGRFHPEYIIDDAGFLTECTYYKNLTVTKDVFSFSVFNFSDPILNYKAEYLVGDDDYVKSRTVTRRWMLMSGTYSEDTKVSTKIYEPMVARDEGRRRRKNLVNRLIIDTVGLFIITSEDLDNVQEAEEDAMSLMKEVGAPISEYYEYGSRRDAQNNPCLLYQTILGSTYSRLDNWIPGTGDTVSIRMMILSRLEPDLTPYKS